MKALVLKDYKQFAYEDVPTPTPGPGEVLVAVKACGICGSDVHGMDGSTGRRLPPIIMGHEAAGTITAVGTDVNGWKAGDNVTLDSTIYCGKCAFCRSGFINLCDNRKVLGVSCEDYRQNGAFAEYVVAPERILYRVPGSIQLEHAALIEPFAIALHAVNRVPLAVNDVVVVAGAGMIGLALVQCLAATACRKIIVIDLAKEKLAQAKTLGATDIIDSSEGKVVERILEMTNGKGADAAFEAVGITPTVDICLRSVRKGGSVGLVGNVAPKIDFPLQVAVTRELNIFGSCASRG